eukprot:m.30962 g.30962  ORF g.30962 m.30962 type:complete len:63 (+) comp13908_c0_seq1:425-613(+)
MALIQHEHAESILKISHAYSSACTAQVVWYFFVESSVNTTNAPRQVTQNAASSRTRSCGCEH